MKKLLNIRKIMDVIIVILLLIVSIKKGGFYKEDSIFFNLCITGIGLIYIIYNCYIKYIKKSEKIEFKGDFVQIFLLGLSFAYVLPIIFKNYSSMSDSIHEMIRYFDLFLIYTLVRSSSNKKIYLNGLYLITFIQCLIGIDGIANRYLEPVLKQIHSGYLTLLDLTRMSGTIQYANVFAVICGICGLLVFNRILKFAFSKENKWKIKTIEGFKFVIYNLFFIVFASSIVLAGSRYVIIMFVIAVFIMLFTIKSNIKFVFLCHSIITAIYTAYINKTLTVNLGDVYLYTIIAYLAIILVFTLLYFLIRKPSTQEKLAKQTFLVTGLTVFFILVFIIAGFMLKKEINIVSGVNESVVTRNIYKLQEGRESTLSLQVKEKEPLSEYKIEIFKVSKDFETTLLQTYHYYSTINGNYEFKYTPEENLKCLSVKITVDKGNIAITKFKLNKHNILDYRLLPSNMIYRLKDSLDGTTSGKDRLWYYSDAIKIATSSPKNLIIGIGGEGFKNVYESYKTKDYSSTEVHNIYLQILVESGIIGLSMFILCIIMAFRKSKNSVYRLALMLFLIHGFFDLNLSYMFSMCVFAIILALQKETKRVDKTSEKILILKDISSILVGTVIVIILIGQNIAYYTKIPKYESDATIKEQENVISKYENIISLDKYESSYRFNLNQEYLKYIKLLEMSGDLDTVEQINQKMEENTQSIIMYDKGNNHVMKKVEQGT
ncbi:MAG: O-antigen ligase family protein [Clostridia bacterium]|nr:O-antigen ligase family protein [Clostridia bacterium]